MIIYLSRISSRARRTFIRRDATIPEDFYRAGWGSLLGNLGAMVGKLFIALVMIAIFFVTVPHPF